MFYNNCNYIYLKDKKQFIKCIESNRKIFILLYLNVANRYKLSSKIKNMYDDI